MLAAFDSWSTKQMNDGELNAASVAKYRPLWLAWLGWVIAQGSKWDGVTAADVQRFLAGPPPGQGGRRPALNDKRMSNYTRQRYWRLLLGVYAEAVKMQTMEDNPMLDVPDAQRPSVADRDRLSQILEPHVFARLRQARHLAALIKTQSEQDWWHVRDRAMLAVLVETGITTAELIALRGMDVREANTQRPPSTSQESLLPSQDMGLLIDVMEKKKDKDKDKNKVTAVERTLPMNPAMSALLRDWLTFRSKLLLERSAKATSLAQRSAFMTEHATQGPLFVARRARDNSEVLPRLDHVTVYYTVSQAIKAMRKELLVEVGDDGPKVAKGPAVIRNSVIRLWLDELGVPETLKRAGLKSERSLRLKPQEGMQNL